MQQVTPSSEAVEAGVDVIEDLLTMLNVDSNEVPEHGGPSTGEVLVTAVLRAAAPLIVAAELERLAYDLHVQAQGYSLNIYSSDDKADALEDAGKLLRERARQLRGER